MREIYIWLIAAMFVGSAAAVMAAKPVKVQEWSNGFPSGEHFNLNIHGKKASYECEPDGGGGSLFVPEFGDSRIDFMMNKKSKIENLTIHDKCGDAFDGDPALVELPDGEYQVYARILAKPAKAGEPSEVVFSPSLVEACNDSGTENFTEATDCEESFLLGTGVVTKDGAYTVESGELVRFDSSEEEEKGPKGKGGGGKGKSTAEDISGLFQWSGWACDQVYDTNGDGEITIEDLNGTDLNGDNVTDEQDLEIYLAENCTEFTDEWIFNIADLVVSGWDYKNNGAKLVQIRFYPVDTTTFE